MEDFKELLAAFLKAQKGKRFKNNALRFNFFLENNLLKLNRELESAQYIPSSYVCFTVHDPKNRKVAAPAFRDRVFQHALVSQVEPLFEKQFIYDSYACRKNKGTHFGLKRLKKFLQAARSKSGGKQPIYCLRMDIQKYFASIDWDILLSIIYRTVKNSRERDLINKIVNIHRCFNLKGQSITPPPDVVNPQERHGLPIGNLTSQLFANVYLNELDHYVKETLHIRWYARYMDDFLIIHWDKAYLEELKDKIRLYLKDYLKLKFHPNKLIIQDVKNGVPFVGYLIFYDHVLIRGNTLRHMQRKYNERRKGLYTGELTKSRFKDSQTSIFGHLRFANSFGLRQKMFYQPTKLKTSSQQLTLGY